MSSRDELVLANLGLVRVVARTVLGAAAQNPDNLREAEQEGCIGLMRAIDAFDPTKGPWSLYARAWIRCYVQKCRQSQTDFAPRRGQRMPREVSEQARRFRACYGREPQPGELSHKGGPVTDEQWKRWTERAHVQTYDTTLGDDAIAAEESDPGALLDRARLRAKLQATLKEMRPRQADIARALVVDGQSVPVVCARFKVSSRRAHEIRKVLADRLRTSSKATSKRGLQISHRAIFEYC